MRCREQSVDTLRLLCMADQALVVFSRARQCSREDECQKETWKQSRVALHQNRMPSRGIPRHPSSGVLFSLAYHSQESQATHRGQVLLLPFLSHSTQPQKMGQCTGRCPG